MSALGVKRTSRGRSREPVSTILLEQRFVTYIDRYPLLEMSARTDGNGSQVFTAVSLGPSTMQATTLIVLSVAQRKAQNV
jgi:hypothetical protein